MEIFIGGCCQNKREYVTENADAAHAIWCDGASAAFEEMKNAQVIDHYHEWIRRELRMGEDPQADLLELLQANPDIWIVADEVGYGVVPLEKEERQFREAVGRTMCIAAKKAAKVTRIVCGIGQVIKDRQQ